MTAALVIIAKSEDSFEPEIGPSSIILTFLLNPIVRRISSPSRPKERNVLIIGP